ncbi:MAG: hypothetical protein LIP77_07040 [Planctomycetes bacterium]|nr:hypothetical protein [Planctomycetota bacterium]
MALQTVIKPNTYRDSIFLMKLSAQAARESGVGAVSAMMATERNKELFTASGLMTPEIEAARANDLAIAIQGEGDAAEAAVALVLRLLDEAPEKPAAAAGETVPTTLEQAARAMPGLNLALISVAGDYARYEAAEALAAGMDVMLYSDNISLADELALKRLARAKGRMVMGPDCGTAIIDGTPLAFANAVAPGPVGVVGASGTGLQEVICLLDRMGVGIRQAYGTGGRDLKDDIGGITTFTAIDRLAADPETKALVLLGKPPGPKTRAAIRERCRGLSMPVFIHYIGADDYTAEAAAGLTTARDLTELAVAAARHFQPGASLQAMDAEPRPARGGFLCGIFGGGTLCQEAAEICGPLLQGDKASNLTVAGYRKIGGRDTFTGHVFWDLGEDEFTVGRPHPMMAPDLKMDRLVAALVDPSVSVVLMDMVIGFGSHPEQGRLAVEALARADRESNGRSRETVVVASVCGTDKDVPSLSTEWDALSRAGVTVLGSNAAAARYAARAVAGTPRTF